MDFLLLVVVAVIVFVLRRSVFRGGGPAQLGKEGEQEVAETLSEGLDAHRYKIFNDIMLYTDKGITTQIDHVVVSQYGVFVIETKNISGWVFASEKSKQWTSTLPALGRSRFWEPCHKYHFQNPIRQNYLHVATLAWHLKIPESSMFSIVVFPDGTEFKKGYPRGVYRYSELISAIRFHETKLFDVNMTRSLAHALALKNAQISDDQRAHHVHAVRAAHGQ